MNTDWPIACDMTVFTNEERARHESVSERLFRLVLETRELPAGYAFRLPANVDTLRLAAEFVDGERLCCPFLDFAIEVERGHGPLWLKLIGRQGVKEFLQASCGPN